MVIWALFDSGNGSYWNVAKDMEGVEVFAIGMDRENKNDHFINLDLADYSRMFGNNTLFDTLDKLPKPDLIIASPPCESWSVASAMRQGNACWKQDKMENMFGTMEGSRFTVRDHKDFEGYQFIPERQILTRLNGELCIFNTIEIIRRYDPQFYIIENPAGGRIWEYIDTVLGFNLRFPNQTNYNNYDYPLKKPTKFGSNLYLNLDMTNKKADVQMKDFGGYNNRSNIPQKLVQNIFKKVKREWERGDLFD